MEEQAKRSPGGKLWALYAFCGILCLGHCALLVGSGKIHVPGASVEGDFGTTAGNGLAPCWVCWSLGIGSILGAVVWCASIRGEQDHQR